MSCKVIVIKNSTNSKALGSGLIYNARDSPRAFDPEFLSAHIRRRKKNLDPNFRTDRWVLAAENECSVQCNVTRKAAMCVLSPVIPVKDHRELQLVPNCSPALHNAFENRAGPHSGLDAKAPAGTAQAADRLKIT
jgi:hypothetical protein